TIINVTLPYLFDINPISGPNATHRTNTSHPFLQIASARSETSEAPGTGMSSHLRRLLFSEVLQNVDASIQELEDLRASYSNQIGDIFNYRYAEASTPQTRAAWLYDSGPDKTIQQSPCKMIVDLMEIITEAFGMLDIALRSQYAQTQPVPSLGGAIRVIFPKNNIETDGDSDTTEKEQDTFSWILTQVVRYTFGWMGISPNGVFAGIQSFAQDFKSSFQCDLQAVQTCNQWKVHVIHATIIYGGIFVVLWTLFSSLGMGFVFSLATPILILIVWGTCYKYYWSCIPMIPVCLVEDFISGIRSIFPRELWIPGALTQTGCTPHSTLPSPACIKRCSSEPVSFNSWMAPVAWWAAELDISSTAWVRWMPGGNEDQYILEQQLRLSIFDSDDEDLKSANRICTLFTLHMTLPYIFVILLTVVLVRVAFNTIIDVVQSWITTM
ncbi:MAG: hypothetical protein EBR93_05915, partial [Bacteroidetes bacterium]|nr:hypothetical protein [Bacteroidota bacterium]